MLQQQHCNPDPQCQLSPFTRINFDAIKKSRRLNVRKPHETVDLEMLRMIKQPAGQESITRPSQSPLDGVDFFFLVYVLFASLGLGSFVE